MRHALPRRIICRPSLRLLHRSLPRRHLGRQPAMRQRLHHRGHQRLQPHPSLFFHLPQLHLRLAGPVLRQLHQQQRHLPERRNPPLRHLLPRQPLGRSHHPPLRRLLPLRLLPSKQRSQRRLLRPGQRRMQSPLRRLRFGQLHLQVLDGLLGLDLQLHLQPQLPQRLRTVRLRKQHRTHLLRPQQHPRQPHPLRRLSQRTVPH